MDAATVRRERFMASAPFQLLHTPGVDVRCMTSEEIELAFNIRRAARRYGRPLAPNEIGCTLAHLRALENFLQATSGGDSKTTMGLICEDDVYFTIDAVRRISAAAARHPDLLFLGYAYPSFPFRTSMVAGIDGPDSDASIVRLSPIPNGAQGYLISRRAASVIVERARRCRASWVADDYQVFVTMGLDVQGVREPILLLDHTSAESHIGNDRSALQAAQERSCGFRRTASWPPRFSGVDARINRAWLGGQSLLHRAPFQARTSCLGRSMSWVTTTLAAAGHYVSARARRRSKTM